MTSPERPWQDPKERELEARDPEQYRLGLEMAFESEQEYRREIQEALEAEKERATKDPLTGLENRRGFEAAAYKILANLGPEPRGGQRSREGRYEHLTVMMIDVDRFKKINDTYTHAGGDAALVALARTLKKLVRPGDVVARFGGEEFAILFPGARAEEVIQKFRDGSKKRERPGFDCSFDTEEGVTVSFTISGGVTEFRVNDPDETLESALKRADALLYRAKESGRDRILGEEQLGEETDEDGEADGGEATGGSAAVL